MTPDDDNSAAEIAISFNADGNSAPYRRGGWYNAEPSHTWTEGIESTIEIDRPSKPGLYLLNLSVSPFTWEGGPPTQELVVAVNGGEVGRFSIPHRTLIECRIPWRLVEAYPSIVITFKHSGAAVPRDVSGANDIRLIALAFHSVALVRSLENGGDGQPLQPSSSEAKPQHASLPLPELATKFESLGENCEFGLVQRRCGAEPLGLLRFSSTPIAKLIDVLGARFEGFGGPDLIDVRLSDSGSEYMVFDKKFEILYHAWVRAGEAEPQQIHERECRRLPFLVAKLIDDLREGQKIFVFHGMTPLTESTVLRLVSAMRHYGDATLLWVELQDEDNAAGTVKELAPGLLKGYMDRFAPSENAHDLSFDMWVTICRNAYALVQLREPVVP